MTKPKQKTGSPRWSAFSQTLSPTARITLLKLLALDANDARATDAMSKVEHWLGFYPGAVKALDNQPRAADYRRDLTPIMKTAQGLMDNLRRLSDWMRGALEAEGADLNGITLSVHQFCERSKATIKNMGRGESRGTRSNNALMQVIRQLRRIFHNYYEGPKAQRTIRGAFQTRSPQEQAELSFLFTALRDAKIIAETYRKELLRLIKDPRCALPHERNAAIERIVRKQPLSTKLWEIPDPEPQPAKHAQRGLREQSASRRRTAHK